MDDLHHSNDIGPDNTPRSRWEVPLSIDDIARIAVEIAGKIKA